MSRKAKIDLTYTLINEYSATKKLINDARMLKVFVNSDKTEETNTICFESLNDNDDMQESQIVITCDNKAWKGTFNELINILHG